MQRMLRLVSVLALALFFPSLANAQLDNKGTDFFMTFLPNYVGSGDIELHLTADAATMVTVNYPVNAPTFSTTVAVAPGAVTIVDIPDAAAQGWTPGAVQNNAVRAFAPAPFVAYMINRIPFTSDAALALPVDVLNTRYYVASYSVTVASEFAVVAPFDDTDVTVTPKGGAPFNFTLNRGEAYLYQSGTDQTGALVEADKPVAMTNGEQCVNVPPGVPFCDHIFEVAQPTASWGNEVLVAPLPNRPDGSRYRVLASQDGTTVLLDGGAFATLNAGEFAETSSLPGAHVFSANNPIFVVQYMTGSQSPGTGNIGDPAMGNMIPSEQYLQAYTFSTVGGGQFIQNFVSIIAETADAAAGQVLLDGVAIPAGDFTPIAGSSYSFAVRPLTSGTHTTSTPGFHGITVEGYNQDDSYMYPGGAKFEFINPGSDETPPLCAGTLSGTTFSGTATDLLSNDPENTGIFFVELGAGSTNLTLNVPPFVPGAESVSYTVVQTDPNLDGSGSVVATDGAGNTCSIAVFIPGGGQPQDTTAPVCGGIQLEFNGPGGALSAINSSASDPESGIASVRFTALRNLLGFVDANGPFAEGDTYTTPDPNPTSVALRGERVSYSMGGALLVLVTNGAGLTATCDPVTAEVGAGVPLTFALREAYPNPFNPTTTLRFDVAEASAVRLSVYDALGRHVATLHEGWLDAGTYTATWDGRSAAGEAIASGVYVVRMEAGAFVQARRVTLLK